MAERQFTTSDKVDRWRITAPLLTAMYKEFQEFSRKKPEGVISKSKIKITNRLLEECRQVLQSSPSIAFLDLFDEDDLPQNSDVVLMLSQYVASMTNFRANHYGFDGLKEKWFTKD